MSQISPPIRILVIAILALVAAWMLVLKPKEEPVEPISSAPNVQTNQPAVSKPGKVSKGAQAAVDATNAKTEAAESLSGTAAKPGAAVQPGTAVQPGAAPANGAATTDPVVGKVKGLPKPIAKAIDDRKVLVLLFWNRKSADDRAVRQQLRKVDRWNGAVRVHTAPVGKVAKYARITRGADVAQSPTTLVVDRNLKVTSLVGFVDTASVDQAVLDALRNSGGFLRDPYLAKVNEVCSGLGRVAFDVANPNLAAEVPSFVASQKRIFTRLGTRFAAIKAPAKWRGFKRATVADHKAMVAFLAEFGAYLGASPSASRVLLGVTRFDTRVQTLGKRYDKRMDGQHVLACGSNA